MSSTTGQQSATGCFSSELPFDSRLMLVGAELAIADYRLRSAGARFSFGALANAMTDGVTFSPSDAGEQARVPLITEIRKALLSCQGMALEGRYARTYDEDPSRVLEVMAKAFLEPDADAAATEQGRRDNRPAFRSRLLLAEAESAIVDPTGAARLECFNSKFSAYLRLMLVEAELVIADRRLRSAGTKFSFGALADALLEGVTFEADFADADMQDRLHLILMLSKALISIQGTRLERLCPRIHNQDPSKVLEVIAKVFLRPPTQYRAAKVRKVPTWED